MTKAGLKFIGDAMEAAGIAYDFMEFTSSIERLETYWVGEYSEQEPVSEDGCTEQQFILTGTGKSSWLCLENEKEKIEELFPAMQGRTAILENGNGIAVFYGNAFHVPTGDGFLKRLQINLVVKEWKVN